jgi:hypothetical protein
MGMAIGWLKLALRSFDMSATLALPARRDGDGGVVATAEPRARPSRCPRAGTELSANLRTATTPTLLRVFNTPMPKAR